MLVVGADGLLTRGDHATQFGQAGGVLLVGKRQDEAQGIEHPHNLGVVLRQAHRLHIGAR